MSDIESNGIYAWRCCGLVGGVSTGVRGWQPALGSCRYTRTLRLLLGSGSDPGRSRLTFRPLARCSRGAFINSSVLIPRIDEWPPIAILCAPYTPYKFYPPPIAPTLSFSHRCPFLSFVSHADSLSLPLSLGFYLSIYFPHSLTLSYYLCHFLGIRQSTLLRVSARTLREGRGKTYPTLPDG